MFEEVQSLAKLGALGLKVDWILERLACPGFQPSGAGIVVCVTGKHSYRIRRDVSDCLLDAIEFDKSRGGKAIEIFDGINTAENWNWIADKIIESERCAEPSATG